MKNTRPILISVSVLIAAMLACNLPAFFASEPQTDIERAVEQTIAAAPEITIQEEAQLPADTPVPPAEAPPTDTPPPSETPTITPTFTPAVPMVSVTNNTNCRTGPGTVYDLLGALLVGEQAEVVARSSVPNYVVIDNPDKPGTNCWLWMQYGQISGSTDGLPVLDPPPTPTPAASPTPEINFNLGASGPTICSGKETVFIKVTNTGAVTIESVQVSAKDQDTSETVSYDSNGFGGSASCISLAVPSISPGNSAYKGAGFTPPIAGHTINITVKACAGDGEGEPCRTKSIGYDIAMISDVDAKANFEPVDNQQILAKVSELEITTWNYTDPNRTGRHIGPMSQDFYSTFSVGQSEEYIYAVDSYGVALAAIQALSDISDAQAEQIELLNAQNEMLIDQNAELRSRMEILEGETHRPIMLEAGLLILAPIITTISVMLVFNRRKRANQTD